MTTLGLSTRRAAPSRGETLTCPSAGAEALKKIRCFSTNSRWKGSIRSNCFAIAACLLCLSLDILKSPDDSSKTGNCLKRRSGMLFVVSSLDCRFEDSTLRLKKGTDHAPTASALDSECPGTADC